jgi:hypothetical protein
MHPPSLVNAMVFTPIGSLIAHQLGVLLCRVGRVLSVSPLSEPQPIRLPPDDATGGNLSSWSLGDSNIDVASGYPNKFSPRTKSHYW